MKEEEINNLVKPRNFNEACDFHDLVKMLIVRMLRRKHQDHKLVKIYTETPVEALSNTFPDIVMKIKPFRKPMESYVWELQDNVTKEWADRVVKRYEHHDGLVIVELKKIKKEWNDLIKQKAINRNLDVVRLLREVLSNNNAAV